MDLVSAPCQDEVWLVALDPTRGSEMQKTRPCLVISPDEMNENLRTAIIAPMTTTARPYPSRVTFVFQGRRGQVALDQLRAVDRERFIKRLGSISYRTGQMVSSVLTDMFARPSLQ